MISTNACSTNNGTSSGSVDGGVDIDAETSTADTGNGTPDAGEQCNVLVQLGTEIQAKGSTAKFADPVGGDVPDGIYVIAETVLQGPTIADGPVAGTFSPATTVQIRGTTYSDIVTRNTGDTRSSGSVKVSGSSTSFTATCTYPKPDGGRGPTMQAGSYSVTPTGFIIYAQAGGVSIKQTYEKK